MLPAMLGRMTGHSLIARVGALSAADPTGLSSPVGRWVILAGLVAALVVLIMQWRRRR